MQRAAGVADSVDDFAADILAKTGGAAAAHLVQAYARAPAAIDALEWAGLRFELLDGFLYPVIAPVACTRCASARARR